MTLWLQTWLLLIGLHGMSGRAPESPYGVGASDSKVCKGNWPDHAHYSVGPGLVSWSYLQLRTPAESQLKFCECS